MIKFSRVSLDNVNTKTIINLFKQHGENVTLKYYYENKIKRKNIFVIGTIISEINFEKDELILILREVLPDGHLRNLFFIRLSANALEQYNEENLCEKDFLVFSKINIKRTQGLNEMCEYEILLSNENTKIWFIPNKKDKLVFKNLNQLKSKNNNIYAIIRSISQGKLVAYNDLPPNSYILFLQIYDHSNLIGVHLILKRNEDIPILEPNWIIRIINMKFINTGDNMEGLIDSAKTVTTFNTNRFPPQTSPSTINFNDQEMRIYCRLSEFLNHYLFMTTSPNSENSSFSENNLLPQNKIALRIKQYSHNMSHKAVSDIHTHNIIPNQSSVTNYEIVPLRRDVLNTDQDRNNCRVHDSSKEPQIPKQKSKPKNGEKKMIKTKRKLMSKQNLYLFSSRENTLNTTNHLAENEMKNQLSLYNKKKENDNKNKPNNSPNTKRQINGKCSISINERNLGKELAHSKRKEDNERTVRENSNRRDRSDQTENSESNDNNDHEISINSPTRKRKSSIENEVINNCLPKRKRIEKNNTKKLEESALEKDLTKETNYKTFQKPSYPLSNNKFTSYVSQISPPRKLNSIPLQGSSPNVKCTSDISNVQCTSDISNPKSRISPPRQIHFNPLQASSPKCNSDISNKKTKSTLTSEKANSMIAQKESNEELNKPDSSIAATTEVPDLAENQKEQIENENNYLDDYLEKDITGDKTTSEILGIEQENYLIHEENKSKGLFIPLANSSPRAGLNASSMYSDDLSSVNDFSLIEFNPIPCEIQRRSPDEEMNNEQVEDEMINYLDTKKIYRILWSSYKKCYNLYKSLGSGLQAFNLDVKFIIDSNISEDTDHLLDYQTFKFCSSCKYFEENSSFKNHQHCSEELEREYIIPLEIELKSRKSLTVFATSSFFDVSTDKFLQNETEFNHYIKPKLKKLSTLSESYIHVKILRIWIKNQWLFIFGSKLEELIMC